MPRVLILCFSLVGFAYTEGQAQVNSLEPRKQATAVRVAEGLISLDGRLDEAVWGSAEPLTDFVQKEPVEGASPTEGIEVRLLYDDQGLYVGARLASSGGRVAIQAPLARRDRSYSPERGPRNPAGVQSGADPDGAELAEYFVVSLDTFLDRRTAYSFGVTASGVRLDHQHLSDSESDIDQRFDPVWEARVAVDDTGWTAEMWIPFAQLRFNDDSNLVWGMNIHRWIPSKNEDDYWVLVPRTDNAWSSRFGDLRGIESVAQTRRLELLPFVAGGSTITASRDPANPFLDELNLEARVGGDLKMGLGPNLTLDATFFPDFGQVEVDPAVINLSDTETLFPERRPFFTEGGSLLTIAENNYLHTRRIGAPPEGPATGRFVDYPRETTIIGAAKVTGRLPSGTSLGILGALTGEEQARTLQVDPESDEPGVVDEVRVTPRVAWGVARIQQEFGATGSTAGLMLTGVRRDLPRGDPLGALLSRNAWVAAGDVLWRFAGGTYEAMLSGGATGIAGDEGAILRAQLASERYFQRPDADHVQVDSSRTSLSGGKGTFSVRKINGVHWLWDVYFDVESPEVTFNDIGRLGSGDGISTNDAITYRDTDPGEWLRSYALTFGYNSEWNNGGERQLTRLSFDTDITWSNFWRAQASTTYGFPSQNHRLTRGGPSMEAPGSWSGSLSIQNSASAETRWNVEVGLGRDDLDGWSGGVEAELSLIPDPRWQVSFAPSYERRVDSRQYVAYRGGGSPATYGGRYIFAYTDRTTLAIETRLSLTLRPDLDFELFAQPFAASGRFFDLGELEAARSRFLRTYGTNGTTIERREDGSLEVTDGAAVFTVPNRDFNLRSFRSTAVLRWEWRPGSALYLVWQQARSRSLDEGRGADLTDLFGSLSASGDNIFAVKVSYWIGI
jgi:hypothetical protein